ncbi:hypothetical protein KC343_g13256 [Hortaea werneckii]|uniref:Arrestin-like N-terminal domain-containing protein n=1 Tax=Hortaea werneckii TaxID=91943 RepID=A0A3M7CQ26_HORWE|nr:hypothetical protein KC317_g13873 [Hortaea werneckii]KAI7606928.1 hypothetical protein KC343_g13256 [Hortaea werneckii]KAI7642464.1 hypothetical protein KC319_g13035 [Hortaea werneckii]KAI7685181.1 hypothetical protein KC322_g13127 [Hortaea werneckii]RMY54201.1 hypothetical protein D0864_13985 [Hortaea werneckii]
MPPAADRPTAQSSPLSGRRILSKITSSFSSKPRNISDFSIEVDDPHRQYSPGDIVHGSVRLRVSRPVRVTHIVVCLHGFVQVFRNPGSPGEGFRANTQYLGTGRGKKSGEYFGNGFASLFEDEVVLCGEGRLAEGSYQFNFELEFPDRDLPSSIDFERGTISYMISATITRPTTMGTTTTCDKKIYFVERIDVAHTHPPKSRTITLEPVSKRSRAKQQARKVVDSNDKRSRRTGSTNHSETTQQSNNSSTQSNRVDGDTPRSPAPSSELSFESQRSSQQRESQGSSEASRTNTSKSSSENKTITASVESLTGGCLRGDNVAIRVHVNHAKPIRSLYGVIVTLYRQARVDLHPAIPLGPTEKGTSSKYEDYYPRSATGLGGLSLSGAGSSHLFRKDLAQVMVPLYVDPATLTADVTARIRVPDEAFPTIATVPGAMISFKYYVEAVVDIQGRLSGPDRPLAALGLTGHHPPGGGGSEGADQSAAFAPYGSSVVDTAPIRRDKSVVTCTFELVVGTRDSERRKGKRKADPVPEDEQPQHPSQTGQQTQSQAHAGAHDEEGEQTDAYWQNGDSYYYDQQWYQQWYPPDTYPYPYAEGYFDYHHPHPYELPPAVPLPRLPDESQLTEKERVRRAEERLLPSQPPGMNAGPSGDASQGPTAPYLAEEADRLDASPPPGPSAPSYDEVSSLGPSASVANTHTFDASSRRHSTVPAYEPPEPGSSSQRTVRPGEDKLELERQRLQAEASAPPDNADTAGPANNLPFGEPSAPSLEQANEGGPERSPPTPRIEESTRTAGAATSNEPSTYSLERSGVEVPTHSDDIKESNITTTSQPGQ